MFLNTSLKCFLKRNLIALFSMKILYAYKCKRQLSVSVLLKEDGHQRSMG